MTTFRKDFQFFGELFLGFFQLVDNIVSLIKCHFDFTVLFLEFGEFILDCIVFFEILFSIGKQFVFNFKFLLQIGKSILQFSQQCVFSIAFSVLAVLLI